MIDFLSVEDVVTLHAELIATSGGSHGIRDVGAIESAVAQPQMTFDGEDFYPSLPEKASALAFSLINNHPFVDGNKRIGYAAMRLFFDLNEYDFHGAVDDQEQTVLAVASGQMKREDFAAWVTNHAHPRPPQS